MSLFGDSLGPRPFAPEDAVRRYVDAIRADLEPDPLFRRRLRGAVVNQFVAAREGLVAPARRRAGMGRLGRAALYASFALAMSVSSVMAASQSAVPGDALYAVKRQIEALRYATLPGNLHDELRAIALAERLSELDVLAAREDWAGVSAVAGTIRVDYERWVVSAADAGSATGLDDELSTLEALFDTLPPRARAAIASAFDVGSHPASRSGRAYDGRSATRHLPSGASTVGPGAGGSGAFVSPNTGERSDGRGSETTSPTPPEPTPRATPGTNPTPKPAPTPKVAATQKPTPTQHARSTPMPKPTERPERAEKADSES